MLILHGYLWVPAKGTRYSNPHPTCMVPLPMTHQGYLIPLQFTILSWSNYLQWEWCQQDLPDWWIAWLQGCQVTSTRWDKRWRTWVLRLCCQFPWVNRIHFESTRWQPWVKVLNSVDKTAFKVCNRCKAALKDLFMQHGKLCFLFSKLPSADSDEISSIKMLRCQALMNVGSQWTSWWRCDWPRKCGEQEWATERCHCYRPWQVSCGFHGESAWQHCWLESCMLRCKCDRCGIFAQANQGQQEQCSIVSDNLLSPETELLIPFSCIVIHW